MACSPEFCRKDCRTVTLITEHVHPTIDGYFLMADAFYNAIANRYIGDILYTRHDSSAIVYYQKAYPDYKNDVDFLYNLGILCLQNRMTDKAQAVLDEIRILNPGYKNIPLLEEFIRKQRAGLN